jgi:hypothetical protein
MSIHHKSIQEHKYADPLLRCDNFKSSGKRIFCIKLHKSRILLHPQVCTHLALIKIISAIRIRGLYYAFSLSLFNLISFILRVSFAPYQLFPPAFFSLIPRHIILPLSFAHSQPSHSLLLLLYFSLSLSLSLSLIRTLTRTRTRTRTRTLIHIHILSLSFFLIISLPLSLLGFHSLPCFVTRGCPRFRTTAESHRRSIAFFSLF